METKKSGKGGILLFSLVISVIGIILLGTGVFFLSRPKAVFSESYNYLTKGFKELNLKNYKKLDLTSKDKIRYDGKINVKLAEDLGLGVNDIDLNLQLISNKSNNTAKIYLDSMIDNQKFIEFISYLKDNKFYLTISNILDKYYYTDGSNMTDDNSATMDDVNVLVDVVNNTLEKIITNDSFTKEKTTTSVDGIEESLTKLSLVVDDKLLSDFVIEIVSEIKGNEDALNALVKLTSSTKDEIIKSMDDAVNSMEVNGNTLFTYNIYYKKINDIKKLELLSGESSIVYSANKGNYRLNVKESGSETLTLSVTKNSDNYDITLRSGDGLNVNGTLVKKDNSYNLTLDLTDADANKYGAFVIDYVYTSSTQNKMTIIYQNDGKDVVTFTIDSSFSFDEDLTIPDLSNAVSIEDISEEDYSNIFSRLQENAIIGPLLGMLGQDDEHYEDDYSDDFLFEDDYYSEW